MKIPRPSLLHSLTPKLRMSTTTTTTTTRTTSTPLLLPSRKSNLGILTLNNPTSLNALTLPMCQSLNTILPQWHTDPTLIATLMKGTLCKNNKPVFCSGGDVKSVYLSGLEQQHPSEQQQHGIGTPGLLTSDFFRHEYQTDYYIATQPQPQISVWDGIVMGGGVGLSVHGRYRVATPTTMFAMPETAIGFFPDVGGTFWLPRLEGGLGVYVALTGRRLNAEDLVYAGIATHFVKSERLEELEERLVMVEKEEDVKAILEEFHCVPEEISFLETHREEIDVVFQNKSSVEDVVVALEEQQQTEFGRETLSTLLQMSPVSLKVTLESLLRGKKLNTIKECLQMEYRMSQQFMKHGKSDFYEGIRAMLVDKCKSPKWEPSMLEDVTEEMVEEFFGELGENELCLVEAVRKDGGGSKL